MLVTLRDLAVFSRPLSRGYRDIKENWTCLGGWVRGMACESDNATSLQLN